MNTDTEERFVADKLRLNEALSRSGIDHTGTELYENPPVGIEAVPVLLNQLTSGKYAPRMFGMIALMLFRRPMDESQKVRAIDICIEYSRRNFKEAGPWVELLACNEIADNAGPQHVKAIGEMLLDKGLGERRSVFARALGIVGNAEAVSFLRAGAKDGETANFAITELARLIPHEEAIQIANTALALPNLLYRKNVEEIRKKLGRKLARRQPIHLTSELPPRDLEEWSTNIDSAWLPKISKAIRKVVEQGFGRAESAEIRTVMDDMSPGQVKRLKFDATFEGKATPLWIQLSCDDEDAFDFFVLGHQELIRRIGSEIQLE